MRLIYNKNVIVIHINSNKSVKEYSMERFILNKLLDWKICRRKHSIMYVMCRCNITLLDYFRSVTYIFPVVRTMKINI